MEPDTEEDTRTKKKGAKPAKSPIKGAEERRERIKLTINNAFDEAQRSARLPPCAGGESGKNCARPVSCSSATKSCAR